MKYELRNNKLLIISFQDIDIEEGRKCIFDYVQVFSGTGQHAVSLGRFCGQNRPDPLISRAHKMMIKFRSDKMLNGKGFKARYTAGQLDSRFYFPSSLLLWDEDHEPASERGEGCHMKQPH